MWLGGLIIRKLVICCLLNGVDRYRCNCICCMS